MKTSRSLCSIAWAIGFFAASCSVSKTGSVSTEPGTATAPTFPEEPFRSTQPSPTAPRPFQLPTVQTFTLGSGIQVYLVEQHDLPVVSATFEFQGGATDDPKGKHGRSSMCMDMLLEGTAKLEKLEFDAALADIASDIRAYSGDDTQGLSFRTLSNQLDATLALFSEALLAPGNRGGDFERLRKKYLDDLKQAKGAAPSVATRVGRTVLYGSSDPRGQIVTEASLAGLQASDCTQHNRDYLRPQGARLFVVGDLTQAQVIEKMAPAVASWKGKPKASVALKDPKSRDGRLFFVDMPGAAQSAIRVVHLGPARKVSEYHANTLMSAVLGGGFSGRINMNLREDKGYSYGAYGAFSYERDHGVFFGATTVRSDATHQSVLEFLDEIAHLQSGAKPVTEAELERERNGAILGLPGDFATARSALSRYRNLVYFGLPLDYYQNVVGEIQKVTLDQVSAAARTQLHPEQARVVVVGDAKAPVIRHTEDGQNVPMTDASGQPLTLLASLQQLASDERLGGSGLVVLDVDGRVKE